MTTDEAIKNLRNAIRAELIAELKAEYESYHPATSDDDDDPYAMTQHYLDGYADAIVALERG